MKTIGRIIHTKVLRFIITDADGKELYHEIEGGHWWTWQYNSDGVLTKWRNSYGYGNDENYRTDNPPF